MNENNYSTYEIHILSEYCLHETRFEGDHICACSFEPGTFNLKAEDSLLSKGLSEKRDGHGEQERIFLTQKGIEEVTRLDKAGKLNKREDEDDLGPEFDDIQI